MAFFFQGLSRGARTRCRRFAASIALSLPIIAGCFFPGVGGCLPVLGCLQFDACASGFREADGDCLLRRSGPMFPFANMMHLLPHKLPSLCAGRFAFACIFVSSFDRFFLRHRDPLFGEVSICRGRRASKNCCREGCWLL